ncbi:hypothetical protein SLS58_005024 [Diplodia intermedia]|uniref:Uncharacterized protein n=1 Tax=Diplodia intermedia TaxID=856260 RepID=A0ABR3TS93_9PEZI
MKLIARIMFVTAAFPKAFSVAVSDVAAEHGSLGVMSLDNIPKGFDAANVRRSSLAFMDDSNSTSVGSTGTPNLQERDFANPDDPQQGQAQKADPNPESNLEVPYMRVAGTNDGGGGDWGGR